MNQVIKLDLINKTDLPAEFEDIRFSEELVSYCLDKYTKEGDVVLDPFVGYGTTVLVSEKMGRIGYGIEINPKVAMFAKSQVASPETIILDDVVNISKHDLPKADFCLTSPYFLERGENNILGAGGYDEFLDDFQNLYKTISSDYLNEGAKIIIEVPNLKKEGIVTTLAFDIVAKLSKIFNFEGETIINLEREYVSGYEFTYLLVFTK